MRVPSMNTSGKVVGIQPTQNDILFQLLLVLLLLNNLMFGTYYALVLTTRFMCQTIVSILANTSSVIWDMTYIHTSNCLNTESPWTTQDSNVHRSSGGEQQLHAARESFYSFLFFIRPRTKPLNVNVPIVSFFSVQHRTAIGSYQSGRRWITKSFEFWHWNFQMNFFRFVLCSPKTDFRLFEYSIWSDVKKLWRKSVTTNFD